MKDSVEKAKTRNQQSYSFFLKKGLKKGLNPGLLKTQT